jgi:carnitine O-acetyltransferase
MCHSYSPQVARGAIGVLSTENRKIWSQLRTTLSSDRNNASCLEIIDDALFVVCLDDTTPETVGDLCSNFLCGTYNLQGGEQVGTCTNRWYDKVGSVSEGWVGLNVMLNVIPCSSFRSLSALMEQLASTSSTRA